MATLTLRDIPAELYERLRESARRSRRSLDREAVARLEIGLRSNREDPERFLAEVQTFQRRLKVTPLTDEMLRSARREGRP